MRRYEIANKEVVDNLERDKVDKIPGKVLSEHDFNSFYKQKIDGFESYVDGKVKTDVPANAKFTDTDTTYSEITTAEIDAGTASTLRTITARRIKYILDKVQGWISSLTKSDIGLGDVDNTSDLAKPISTATQTELNLKADKTQVLTNVPVDAKFTDTVYTHPSTHSASMVTGLHSVATSGNYTQLVNKPTKLSDFVDDVKPYYKDNLPPVKTDKLWLDTSK